MDHVTAGEYALGLLTDDERRAFERALAHDPPLAEAVRWWEARLADLALALRPVAPHPLVWLRLRRAADGFERLPSPRAIRATRTWAAVATAGALVLGFGLWRELTRPAPEPAVVTERVEAPAAAAYVALLQVPRSSLQWSVSLVPERRQLVVRAVGTAPAVAANRDAELWLITDAGPRSLGVIPQSGEIRRSLAPGLPVGAGRTLAVSLEAKGGSATGRPQGPVVTTGVLMQAG